MLRLICVRLCVVGAVLTGLVAVGQAAIDLVVGPAAIEQALRLARSSEPERARFHTAYALSVSEPLVERLEIITEYRRMVLIAEERLAAGDWTFAGSVRAAEEALRPWKQKLTVRARIRFPPLHAYPNVPPISIKRLRISNRLQVTTASDLSMRGTSMPRTMCPWLAVCGCATARVAGAAPPAAVGT